jgi:dipeptidyl aminopeptidase/acylaminoacyl peptidase
MKKLILPALVMALASPICAQTTMTPELLWQIARISDEKVSPDGSTVLFGITTYDLKENKGSRDLYAVRMPSANPKGKELLKGGGGPLRLTNTAESEQNARWRPDGKKIGYLSPVSGSMQLWEMNPDGTGALQVSEIEGGLSNFDYAPDGIHISYSQDVKLDQTVNDLYPDLPKANARIIDDLMYRHWSEWHDYAYSHVFYARNEGGKIVGPTDIMRGERYRQSDEPARRQ